MRWQKNGEKGFRTRKTIRRDGEFLHYINDILPAHPSEQFFHL